MMSTISDKDAVLEVLKPSIPVSVIKMMISKGLLKKTCFPFEGRRPVG